MAVDALVACCGVRCQIRVDLDDRLLEIDDPIKRDAGARVERGLFTPVMEAAAVNDAVGRGDGESLEFRRGRHEGRRTGWTCERHRRLPLEGIIPSVHPTCAISLNRSFRSK